MSTRLYCSYYLSKIIGKVSSWEEKKALRRVGPSNRLYGRSGGVKWGRLYVVPLIRTLFFASLLCPFSTWGRKVEIVVFSLSLPFPVYFFLSDKFKINIQVGKRWQLKIPNIFLKNRTYQNRGLHFMFATVARFHNMNVLSNIKHFSYKSLNVTDISFSVLLSLQCINVCWILYANRILLHTTFHCECPQYGNYRNFLSHPYPF